MNMYETAKNTAYVVALGVGATLASSCNTTYESTGPGFCEASDSTNIEASALESKASADSISFAEAKNLTDSTYKVKE